MLKYTPQAILIGFVALALLLVLRDHPVFAAISAYIGFFAAYVSSRYV